MSQRQLHKRAPLTRSKLTAAARTAYLVHMTGGKEGISLTEAMKRWDHPEAPRRDWELVAAAVIGELERMVQ